MMTEDGRLPAAPGSRASHRAADGVSPVPASIPSAADVWLSKVPQTDIFAVVGPGGRDIGFVRKIFRTIEKDIPGKMYVAWRRKAKTPTWRAWLKGEGEPVRSSGYDTRQRAVESLLRDYASAIEARRAETQGGSVEDESAGPKDDAQTPSQGPSA